MATGASEEGSADAVGEEGISRSATVVPKIDSTPQETDLPQLSTYSAKRDENSDQDEDRPPTKKAKTTSSNPFSETAKLGDEDLPMEEASLPKKEGTFVQQLNDIKRKASQRNSGKKKASDTEVIPRPPTLDEASDQSTVEDFMEDFDEDYAPEKKSAVRAAPAPRQASARRKAVAKGANKKKARAPVPIMRTPLAMPKEEGGPKKFVTWKGLTNARLEEAIKARDFWDEFMDSDEGETKKAMAEALVEWDLAILKGEIRMEIEVNGPDYKLPGREETLDEMLADLPANKVPKQTLDVSNLLEESEEEKGEHAVEGGDLEQTLPTESGNAASGQLAVEGGDLEQILQTESREAASGELAGESGELEQNAHAEIEESASGEQKDVPEGDDQLEVLTEDEQMEVSNGDERLEVLYEWEK
ncbi:hypothetical protein BU16DRAFT_534577 [Lophium mytilinum]|uniref:Uncharacterized protein n=1 Tax=Lophium mytilinum TaxID=390894 RepID=A0A6A6R863_9PEZI|nr:hypothetical protein BU16DRAFT_534577 [Lophium mytilinum]